MLRSCFDAVVELFAKQNSEKRATGCINQILPNLSINSSGKSPGWKRRSAMAARCCGISRRSIWKNVRANAKAARRRCRMCITRISRSYFINGCEAVMQGRVVLGILTYFIYAPVPALRPPLPDSLSPIYETCEGPLDLLLYLIRRQNFNVLDIPMTELTRQYLEYIERIRARNLELAAEYLLMAALLIEIKSRLLLPINKENAAAEEGNADPRAELARRLLEYERIKGAARAL